MLIAGGWTYNSIIATKPELEKKIGTELTPAGPSGKGTAFAGGSHLVQFQESKNKELGAAFVDFMLEPDQLNKFTGEIGFLPGHDRRHQGVGLPRGPAAQAVRRAVARPLGGLPAVAEVGRPGGREHLRRRDPEGDEGPGHRPGGRGRARQEDGRGVRRVSSAPAAVDAGRAQRAPRPPAAASPPRGGPAHAAGAAAAAGADHHRRRWSAIRSSRTVYLSFTDTGLGELIYGGCRGSGWRTSRRSSPTSTCGSR